MPQQEKWRKVVWLSTAQGATAAQLDTRAVARCDRVDKGVQHLTALL